MYLQIRDKFAISLFFASLWAFLSYIVATGWISDLSLLIGSFWAHFIILGIAIFPGFMNAFLIASICCDNRPKLPNYVIKYPPITILIAAYNEEANISDTLDSIKYQNYRGPIDVIVVDDGSTDKTLEVLKSKEYPWLKVIAQERNQGKAAALNRGLKEVKTALTITIDADSYLWKDALANIVGRYIKDPEKTVAVAGAPFVRNSRTNLVTRAQEWDYFHGIAAIKRLQSMYHGTMVAQGAFSLYETEVLREIGGWEETVGEDIVLTWALHERGHRVGFAENACLFTNAPETWGAFIRQRQRWSRGIIEGFLLHPKILFKNRYSAMFAWWNLMFPYMDVVYTFAFIPGIVLAFFGHYWIVGPLTLLLLPLAMTVNYIMYGIQFDMFKSQGLEVRRNPVGFFFYSLLYSFVLQPACTLGYITELFRRPKIW